MYLSKLPEVVKLGLTNGKDEDNAFYTRSNDVIIMCEKYWEGTATSYYPHEMFHIMSKFDQSTIVKPYDVVGYKKVGKVNLPADIT